MFTRLRFTADSQVREHRLCFDVGGGGAPPEVRPEPEADAEGKKTEGILKPFKDALVDLYNKILESKEEKDIKDAADAVRVLLKQPAIRLRAEALNSAFIIELDKQLADPSKLRDSESQKKTMDSLTEKGLREFIEAKDDNDPSKYKNTPDGLEKKLDETAKALLFDKAGNPTGLGKMIGKGIDPKDAVSFIADMLKTVAGTILTNLSFSFKNDRLRKFALEYNFRRAVDEQVGKSEPNKLQSLAEHVKTQLKEVRIEDTVLSASPIDEQGKAIAIEKNWSVLYKQWQLYTEKQRTNNDTPKDMPKIGNAFNKGTMDAYLQATPRIGAAPGTGEGAPPGTTRDVGGLQFPKTGPNTGIIEKGPQDLALEYTGNKKLMFHTLDDGTIVAQLFRAEERKLKIEGNPVKSLRLKAPADAASTKSEDVEIIVKHDAVECTAKMSDIITLLEGAKTDTDAEKNKSLVFKKDTPTTLA